MTRFHLCLPAALLSALLAPGAGAWAAVAGRVVAADGAPVEGARVEAPAAGLEAISDADGRFVLADCEPPIELRVVHPDFEPAQVTVPATEGSEVEILLARRRLIFEEVVVSAARGGPDAPTSIAATLLEPATAAAPPASLTELVASAPGVAENGQGGLFQTYSVRGVSRQRILTLVAGARIVGERRAGVSASFLDPLLVGSVDVLRGPSSTYYGSGALGGVVQLFPRAFDGWHVESGFASQGDELTQAVAWGGDGWSLAGALRRADGAETPDGEPLFSGFRQTSGTVARAWTAAGLDWDVLAVASAGRDIEKSSTDFPRRLTVYPEENHLLVRLAVEREGAWRLEAFAHPNDLETRVAERDGRGSRLVNEATDLGLNWQRELAPAERVSARFGVDWFGRRGVSARERAFDATGAVSPEARTLDGAEEDEAGLYGAAEWRLERLTLLGGSRLAWQRQDNGGEASVDDTAWTGFAGAVVPLGRRLELKANVGSGLRFPSLSERYFSGVTGRGRVTGSAGLDAERSLNADLGLRWAGNRLFVSGWLFRNEIDDYIERIEVEPDVLTFVNLTSGTLEGIELEGLGSLPGGWSLAFGGHALEGRDDAGSPLADVPADRLFVEPRYDRGRFRARLRWERRAAKDDPGSGEKPIAAADLVSASIEIGLGGELTLRLSGRNLLDETYFNSADRKVPLSPGRSLGLSLRWTSP